MVKRNRSQAVGSFWLQEFVQELICDGVYSQPANHPHHYQMSSQVACGSSICANHDLQQKVSSPALIFLHALIAFCRCLPLFRFPYGNIVTAGKHVVGIENIGEAFKSTSDFWVYNLREHISRLGNEPRATVLGVHMAGIWAWSACRGEVANLPGELL